METNSKAVASDLAVMLSESWKAALITAGLNAGIFDELNNSEPVSITKIASKLDYDADKLDKWFYYCEHFGIVARQDGGYLLTPMSNVFMPDSQYKDLSGFIKLNDYFMRSAVDADEFFKEGKSLDKLKDGKITRNYQPQVSDNLSVFLIDFFKKYKMTEGGTLLDIGCGIGEFARKVVEELPLLHITGFDSNLFAIEWGKNVNKKKGLTDRIKLMVDDAIEDIGGFSDRSYDWVMAINLFHFFPPKHRMELIDNMIRIAKKGVFFTEGIVEKSPITFSADPLMSLLFSDFTGFFREKDSDAMHDLIIKKHSDCKLEKYPIAQNSSYLIAVTKS